MFQNGLAKFQQKRDRNTVISGYSWHSWLLILFGAIAIGIPANSVVAQISEGETEETTEATEAEPVNLEAAIIQEINRARTDPQGYADWLTSQKQYYDGMVLRLPGEKPLRTNRGMKTLDEAISFVRRQRELPPISSASALVNTAQSHVRAIVNNQSINYQDKNLVYGKATPEAIVMQLVVDDGFPDRRHRRAIFNLDNQQAGVVCSEIPVYDRVCAVAYKVDSPDNIARESENETVAANPNAVIVPTKPILEENKEPATEPNPEATTETDLPELPTETETKEPETAEVSEIEAEIPETETATEATSNTDSEEVTEAETLETEAATEATETEETEAVEAPEANSTTDSEEITETPEAETAEIETTEPETTANTEEIAAEPETEVTALPEPTPATQASETIETGTLQEGDEVIPNDGSFYDSYPIEGTAGDTFIITLESADFDTFLAVMDKDGNIIEQNDDIDEQNSNSRLELTLPDDGTYTIIINTYDQQGTGNYTLKLLR